MNMTTLTFTTKLASLASVFLLLSQNISPSAADKDLIVGTCKQTPYSKLCVSTLTSDPRGLKANDVRSLALVLIDAVEAKGMVVYKMVKKLLATKPELKKPLKECEQDYDYLVHDAHDEAVEAVSEGAPKFGEDAMSGSQTVPQSCEYWFKEYGKKSPLTRVNSAVYEIASVARAVIRLLE